MGRLDLADEGALLLAVGGGFAVQQYAMLPNKPPKIRNGGSGGSTIGNTLGAIEVVLGDVAFHRAGHEVANGAPFADTVANVRARDFH